MKIRSLDKTELAFRKIEANVYFQIVRDLCIEMYNDKQVKSLCRTDYISILSVFEKIDKRSRRLLGSERQGRGEQLIADIADDSQEMIDECVSELAKCLEGIVVEDKIKFAILLGMISGFIDCIQQIYIYLKGRKSSDMNMVLSYIKHTESIVKVESCSFLQPDFKKMQATMTGLFESIGRRCLEEARK